MIFRTYSNTVRCADRFDFYFTETFSADFETDVLNAGVFDGLLEAQWVAAPNVAAIRVHWDAAQQVSRW